MSTGWPRSLRSLTSAISAFHFPFSVVAATLKKY